MPCPRDGITLLEVLVAVAIVGLLVALVLPAVARARNAAALSKESNTLRQAAQALHQHATEHSRLPREYSGYVFDGWVPAVLQYSSEHVVLDRMNLSKNIDAEENLKIASHSGPESLGVEVGDQSSHVVISSDNRDVSVKVPPTPIRFNASLYGKPLGSVGQSTTTMLVIDGSATPWCLSPDYLEIPDADGCQSCGDRAVRLEAFADGSVHLLSRAGKEASMQ